jgi:hypothetical protein
MYKTHRVQGTNLQDTWWKVQMRTSGLGVELVERLDGQQLVLALVVDNTVQLTAHNQVHSLSNRVAPVSVRHAGKLVLISLADEGVGLPALVLLPFLLENLNTSEGGDLVTYGHQPKVGISVQILCLAWKHVVYHYYCRKNQ